MKNQIILLCASCALSACSWVDKTGSQKSTLDLESDASAAVVNERDVFDITLSNQVDQAFFTLQAEGSSAAGNCGSDLLPTDSAATLTEACGARSDIENCEINFVSSGNGNYTATVPALQQSIALRYLIKAEDVNGVIDEQDLTMCLKAVNDAPVALDHEDYQVTYRGTLETGDAVYEDIDNLICQYKSGSGVLKGATDDYDYASVNLDNPYPCLSATVKTEPQIASSFSLNPLGGFSYSPAPSLGPGQTDSFTYVANDGELDSTPKTVTITVIGENEPPEILTFGTLSVEQNGEGSIAITSLARDPEGEKLNIAGLGTPNNGTAFQSTDGLEISYMPDEDYVGDDSFSFTVEDVAGEPAQGEIDVEVVRSNQAPSIDAPNSQGFNFDNGSPYAVSFNVTVNDREDDSSLLQLSASSSRTNIATVSTPRGISSDGSAVISINPIANGSTTITLTVTDRGLSGAIQRPAKSATATVLVSISNINRAPTGDDDSATVAPGSSATFDLGELSRDLDGDSLSFELISAPNNASLSGDRVTVTTTSANAGSTITVNYRVSDRTASDTGTLTVRVSDLPNTAPVAQDASTTVAAGETATFNLRELTSDDDGDTLRFAVVSGDGTLSGNTVTVRTSEANAGNTITVVYRASDDDASDTGTLTVRVSDLPEPENTPPVAGNDSASVEPGTSATFNLEELSSDADGDDLTFSEDNARASISGNILTVTTNNADAGSTIRVSYEVSDGEDSDTGTLTVRVSDLPEPENTPPVASNDSASVEPGTSATFNLGDLSSDADGDDLTFTENSARASISGNILTVTTNNEDAGSTIRVSYEVSDGEDSDTGTLSVAVEDLPNTPPETGNVVRNIQAGQSTSLDLSTISSDDDDDRLRYNLIGTYAGVSLSGSTISVQTEATAASQKLTINFSVSDAEASANGTLTVNITALVANRSPSAGDASLTVTAGTSSSLDLNNLVSDPDIDDTLVVSLDSPPPQAALIDANFTYTAALTDEAESVDVNYSVTDGELSDSGTITVTVSQP